MKLLAAIVYIGMLLPLNLTTTQFGKIAYYNKESVNNMVHCPEKDSKEVTDCLDGCKIDVSVVIIAVNSI